jgi:flagellar basal-body rod protein FlgB
VSTIKQLEQYLNYTTAKNRVISKNIANVGTKNYKREDLVFKNVLSEAQNSSTKTTNAKHISNIGSSQKGFEVKLENSGEEDASGVNNVDIEQEMAALAENTINFKLASKKVSSYYKTLRAVIQGNGGGR